MNALLSDKLLAEQNFSNSDRANPTSAAKIGQLLGVDTIIIGSITQFGRDDKHTNIGGGGFGSKYGLGGIGTKNSKAIVAVSARMVNVNTGEIISAVTGTEVRSSRGGTSLLGAGGGRRRWRGVGAVDMGSSNFGNTILGEATHKAVDDMGAQLDASATKVPTNKLEVSGLVADVSGNTLIVNVGKKAGLKVGDVLDVSRPVRVVKDPATGKVIKSITDEVGLRHGHRSRRRLRHRHLLRRRPRQSRRRHQKPVTRIRSAPVGAQHAAPHLGKT